MLPVISPGALLSIEPGSFQNQQPRPGEIVAFQRGETLVCHRFYGVLKIGARHYGIERGDNNRIAGLFRLEAYVGRLTVVDSNAAEELFREVQKPPLIILIWGLLRERFDWLFRK